MAFHPLAWIAILYGWIRSIIRRIVIYALRAGPIPNHVAFIMDGNRRFARKKNEPVAKGHEGGSEALRNVLEVCMRLGIPCVSVYAFSIENFKRPKDEVDALMALMKKGLIEISQHGDILEQYSVRVAGIGRTDMLRPDVLDVLRRVEDMTKDNKKALFNICMPYTSRDEIATAVSSVVRKTVAEQLRAHPHGYSSDDEFSTTLDDIDITEEDIEAELLTSAPNSPPLDILVRTSGVRRLSDYYLWQCNENTQVHFLQRLWPDFGLRDLVPILMDYQKKQWTQQRLSSHIKVA